MTGAGRPRLSTKKRPGDTAREEILDASAELFTTRGFTNTSTRVIAEAVGLRQASLYHHFATKDGATGYYRDVDVEGQASAQQNQAEHRPPSPWR